VSERWAEKLRKRADTLKSEAEEEKQKLQDQLEALEVKIKKRYEEGISEGKRLQLQISSTAEADTVSMDEHERVKGVVSKLEKELKEEKQRLKQSESISAAAGTGGGEEVVKEWMKKVKETKENANKKIETTVKGVINDVYVTLREDFEDGTSYDGATVMNQVMSALRDKTVSKLNELKSEVETEEEQKKKVE